MPALAPGMTLPDITGLPPVLPWYEVDRLQGVQSFPADPARALLELWPVFRRHNLVQGSWTGAEPPLAVLTDCWRGFVKACEAGSATPGVDIDQDEQGYFIAAEIGLQNAIPDELMLYWADLRHLPRLRERNPRLWNFASDGLALLLGLGLETFERWIEWFDEGWLSEYELPVSEIRVQVGGGAEVQVSGGAGEEERQLREVAPQIIGAVRERNRNKGLLGSFQRRVRRAAMSPAWVEWGGQVLTAVRDLGPLWELVDQETVDSGDFDGEFFTSMFALSWSSPRFLFASEQMFNDVLNSGSGMLMPTLGAKLRGNRPAALDALRAKARDRASGLRALAEALEDFNNLAEQACGVIDVDPQ